MTNPFRRRLRAMLLKQMKKVHFRIRHLNQQDLAKCLFRGPRAVHTLKTAWAKAETPRRFWGLYVHVCNMETLRAAYALAKDNDGAPGVDVVTFAVVEAQGVEAFLEQISDELVGRTYVPPAFPRS
jgi:hypothetical protein